MFWEQRAQQSFQADAPSLPVAPCDEDKEGDEEREKQ